MSHFNYEICERFAPIFLRRTHVKIELSIPKKIHVTLIDPRSYQLED
ncbi:hypothetical protein LEP1GSC021_4982 [Leptospira noguchii str. 1993005606]|nr:hypothetical protein LEP1GSC021_4982 [Leptospira noguchii str. 1993005606]